MKVAYDICKELAKRGHEVEVFTTNAYDQTRNFKPKVREQLMNGFKVMFFNNLIRSSNIFFSPEMIAFLHMKLKDFDVVHTHFGRQPYDIAVHYYSKIYGVPYVLQAHGSLPRIMAKQRLKWVYDVFFGYRLLRDADKVIALNDFEAKRYKAMGVLDERIVIIPNGIDLAEYAKLPAKGCFKRKFGIPEEKRIILYLGRIHKTKGIDFLIKAFAYLKNGMGVKDIVLVIGGPDDGYLNEAKALEKSLGISNSIIFTGFISKKHKIEALVDAEVFVTPSFYGFPLTFLEACAVGTPIVTTSMSDFLDWIDGKAGYVAKPSINDFAEKIYTIIASEELKKTISKSCLNLVKEFSIEKVVYNLEKIYKEIINN
ncbi:MAG: glycosyltransferase [Candidatus Aenigmatarchaeota archaeon]